MNMGFRFFDLFGRIYGVTLFSSIAFCAVATIFTAADLDRAMRRNSSGQEFELKAKIISARLNAWIAVEDDTGAVILEKCRDGSYPTVLRAGDMAVLRGSISTFVISFATAECRSIDIIGSDAPPVVHTVSIREFTSGKFDSQLVRVRGLVKDVFRDELDPAWTYLVLTTANDAIYAAFMTKDQKSFDGASLIGCEVLVDGICNPNEGGARHHTGRTLIAENKDSLIVIRKPVFWTLTRLLVVSGILLAALIAVFLWNIALRIAVERKSRDLLRSNIAQVKAELRVDERTRLATELHDSVAQDLLGISLQIDTALRIADTNRDRMLQMMKSASRMLKMCRDELRNSLWDLRNKAFDEPDMDKAIRQTLAPHIGDARIRIRFDVPRQKLQDSTAHDLFRILRELTSNAVVHGGARNIMIAGVLDAGKLRFSVQDDGIGFIPDSRPNTEQGHFGLDGIRERVLRHHGTMQIVSSPGKGCKVSITLS